MYTAKHASIVKDRVKDAEVYVSYIDVRAYGKSYEEFYKSTQESGTFYIRGIPGEITQGKDGLLVRVEDMLSGEVSEIEVDLVVLATGVRPRKGTEDSLHHHVRGKRRVRLYQGRLHSPVKDECGRHLRLRHGFRPEGRSRYGGLRRRSSIEMHGVHRGNEELRMKNEELKAKNKEYTMRSIDLDYNSIFSILNSSFFIGKARLCQ